jgi:Tfp pilus assembly protein PilE
MKNKGLTIVDVITFGIILLILGISAIPHVKASRVRARETHTRTNMHTLQLTAEDFATLADGVYPVNLSHEVEEACPACSGDNRNIAENYIAPFGTNSLLPNTFMNPFSSPNDALMDDDGTSMAGRVNYFDFDATGNSSNGYSIRGTGSVTGRYMSLVLISSR